MTTSDGRTIVGTAKEKAQAREEYEDAVGSGKYAGILDYVTDDSQYCHLRCLNSNQLLFKFSLFLLVPYQRK